MEFVNLSKKKLRYYFLRFFITIITLFILGTLQSQNNRQIPDDFCISGEENQLFESINIFLTENGKKPLQLSKSLSYVAKTHIADLKQNNPDTSICNLSSWSNNGEWTACCYNSYVPNPDCMWDKPKELTSFQYRGYELALYFEEEFNTDTIMQLLYSSNRVLDMLLTKGEYSAKKWVCMGIGINENYTSIWFAQRTDKNGTPGVCDNTVITEGEVVVVSKPKYYIIASSFTKLKDAREALKRLKQNGFEDAGILKSGINIRVYLNELESLKEAMYFKQKLPYTYNDAWILKE